MEFILDPNEKKFEGAHAFLSPSQYHWIRYNDDKIVSTYKNYQQKEWGTRLHAYACESILLGQKLPRSRQTLNMFVNDAIGFHMTPEVLLFYSENFFGTTDAISFDEKTNMLRIHDLKTGTTPAHMEQLRVYMALFCLRYKYKPIDIKAELRIYQSCNIDVEIPDPEEIQDIMNIGVRFDKLLKQEKNDKGGR